MTPRMQNNVTALDTIQRTERERDMSTTPPPPTPPPPSRETDIAFGIVLILFGLLLAGFMIAYAPAYYRRWLASQPKPVAAVGKVVGNVVVKGEVDSEPTDRYIAAPRPPAALIIQPAQLQPFRPT